MEASNGSGGSGGSGQPEIPAHVLRSGGSVVMGIVSVAALVFVAVAAWPGNSRLGGVAVLGAVSCYLVLVHPMVRVDSAGVFVANPLRWIRVPWPAIEAAGWQWSLEVYAEGRAFAAWALAAKMDRIPLRGSGAMSGPGEPAGSRTDRARSATGPMTAQRGAAIIEQARADWRTHLADSGLANTASNASLATDMATVENEVSARSVPRGATRVDHGWHVVNVGLLGAGIAAVVVGWFTA